MATTTYDTRDGGSVDAIFKGAGEVELITRNAKGDVISTVYMNSDDARGLLYQLADSIY